MMRANLLLLMILTGGAASLLACPAPTDTAGTPGTPEAVVDEHKAVATTNRIDVPPEVVRNLGITFVPVKRRAVGATLRLRGHFEAQPTAYQAVHTLAGGRVELLVRQLQRVEQGDIVARMHVPGWAARQARIAEAELAVDAARAAVVVAQRTLEEAEAQTRLAARLQQPLAQREEAHAAHVAALREVRRVHERRAAELEAVAERGGGVAAALAEVRTELARLDVELAKMVEEDVEFAIERERIEVELALMRNRLPRLQAELAERDVQVRHAKRRIDLLLDEAERELGLAAGWLREQREPDGQPRWRTLTALDVVAPCAGLIESFAVETGAVVEAGAHLLRLLDERDLRFRATAYQADIAKLASATEARILPPGERGTADADATVPSTLAFGLHADPRERTFDLLASPSATTSLPAWARPGVSTLLDVVIEGSTAPVLAIPLRAVITDGLERVYFRRDPRDPNKVIREVGDFGASDGEFIVVNSGLSLRDTVVLHGVYELKLASAGTQQMSGGHFHADGTWHAEGH